MITWPFNILSICLDGSYSHVFLYVLVLIIVFVLGYAV